MSEREIITRDNAGKLDRVTPPLAQLYQRAFAAEPWYEVSRCANDECDAAFSPADVGTECGGCDVPLVEAYNPEELRTAWETMVREEEAMFEVAYDETGQPVRVTIARPTTSDELWRRKYQNQPQMRDWLTENVPEELVWIEDTFADTERRPRGNLDERAKTLSEIAMRYSGLTIATRTLRPAVIRATVRDLPDNTEVYLGTARAGEGAAVGARKIDIVPDARTLMQVKGLL